jgi:DNA-binding response OmpR family regulator
MNILIIEDFKPKLEHIISYVKKIVESPFIDERYSFQSGLKSILEKDYDLILLDMSLPTYDIEATEKGGVKRPFAGREILRQMNKKSIIVPVIVITQFDYFGDDDSKMSLNELTEQLKSFSNFKGTIVYNAKFDWKNELKKIING